LILLINDSIILSIVRFNLSEEQILIRNSAREFAKTELLPGVIERDELQNFPDNLVKKMCIFYLTHLNPLK